MGVLEGKNDPKLPKLERVPYWGNHFWARGYFISTVGLDSDTIRRYVKYQENEECKDEINPSFRGSDIKATGRVYFHKLMELL